MTINIFYLEDDAEIISAFEEAIERYKKINDINLILTAVKTLEAAEQIDLKDFDCAIIDLKIGTADGVGADYISNKIYDKLIRIPTIIYTGTPDDIPNIPIMSIFDKGYHVHHDVITYIHQVYKTGLTKILGAKGTFETTLHKVFQDFMIPDHQAWIEYIKKDGIDVEKSLLRHVLNIIYYLLNNEHEKLLPEECYIKYQSDKPVRTGLICYYENKKYVVITPACDLANNKTTYIQLLEIDSYKTARADYEKIKNKVLTNSEAKQFDKSLNDNNINNYHFLPKANSFEPGYINFRKFHGIEKEFFDSQIKANRIQFKMQISPYFMKDIIARFSSYYARQGQPLLHFC